MIKIDPADELAAAIKNIPKGGDESEDESDSGNDEEKIKCDNDECQVEFDSTAGKVRQLFAYNYLFCDVSMSHSFFSFVCLQISIFISRREERKKS